MKITVLTHDGNDDHIHVYSGKDELPNSPLYENQMFINGDREFTFDVTDKQCIIDLLTAVQRGSLMLYDNLGITINQEEAIRIFCISQNAAPTIGDIFETPYERRIWTPDNLSFAERAYAIAVMALITALNKRR